MALYCSINNEKPINDNNFKLLCITLGENIDPFHPPPPLSPVPHKLTSLSDKIDKNTHLTAPYRIIYCSGNLTELVNSSKSWSS